MQFAELYNAFTGALRRQIQGSTGAPDLGKRGVIRNSVSLADLSGKVIYIRVRHLVASDNYDQLRTIKNVIICIHMA